MVFPHRAYVIILRWKIGAVIFHLCLDSSFLCVLFFFFLFFLIFHVIIFVVCELVGSICLASPCRGASFSWSCQASNVFDPECCKQIKLEHTHTHMCVQTVTTAKISRYKRKHTHTHMLYVCKMSFIIHKSCTNYKHWLTHRHIECSIKSRRLCAKCIFHWEK